MSRRFRLLAASAAAVAALATVGVAGPASATISRPKPLKTTPIISATTRLGRSVAATQTPVPSKTPTTASFTTGHPAVVVSKGKLALRVGNQVQPWMFTGINAYDLGSLWGVNDGCGWGEWNPTLLDKFFSELPPNAMVRTWFFQTYATQIVNGVAVRNWSALDQMMAEADKYNVHLVLTLGNQDGTCEDASWKNESWYAGGYQSIPSQTYTPSGPGRTSYAQWVHDAVSRYANRPSVAMWEPMNEPQATTCGTFPGWNCWSAGYSCGNEQASSNALLNFFGTIGAEIHALDPTKLVSDGSLGGGGCGTVNSTDFQKVIASPGIDVVGYHDYSGSILPPDLAPRTAEAAAIGKPTMVGESGVTGCAGAAARATIYGQKIAAAKAVGVSAYLPWWYDGDNGDPTCNSGIDFDAPSWSTIMGAGGANGAVTGG